MKDFTFYLEYDSDKNVQTGNIFAIYQPTKIWQYVLNKSYECFRSETHTPNDIVEFTQVSSEYLFSHCTKIGEMKARITYPKLFETLKQFHEGLKDKWYYI